MNIINYILYINKKYSMWYDIKMAPIPGVPRADLRHGYKKITRNHPQRTPELKNKILLFF